jgi:hypothetical protein
MGIEIKDIFPVEDRDIIYRYINKLNRILKDNDRVIFMARKAICFYKALQQNGYIEPSRKRDLPEASRTGWLDPAQQVLSTRMLTFNMLEDLQDERLKIALVDDVVVTGKSLSDYHNLLNKKNIKHTLYALAAENTDDNSKSEPIEFGNDVDRIEVRRLYRLAREITNYIEASMVPYNIDTPIYRIQFHDEKECLLFLNSLPITDVTTALQKKHGMHCSMLPFNKEDIVRSNPLSEGIILEFAKIRFYYRRGDSSVLVVPFVLFEITDILKAQDALGAIKTEFDLVKFAARDDDKEQQAVNVHKILFHYYSELLLTGFLKEKGLFDSEHMEKIHSNQRFTFGTAEDFYEVNGNSFAPTSYVAKGYQRAELQEYTDILYKDILSGVNSANSNLVLKPEIDYPVFTLKSMRESIERLKGKGSADEIKLSAALDIINDSGILVPTIIYQKESNAEYGQVLRAYRHGEVEGDIKNELSYFAYMLQEYLRKARRKTIGKLEATKLSVLLFRELTGKPHLSFNKGEVDKDGVRKRGVLGDVCFSFYGPVAATSEYCLNSNEKEFLLTRLAPKPETVSVRDEKLGYPYLKEVDWKYLLVNEAKPPEDQNTAATIKGFAANYQKIVPWVKSEIDELKNENKSFLIRNTNDYLTLRAIGQANKYRAQALVAEIEIIRERVKGELKSLEDYYNLVYRVPDRQGSKEMRYPVLKALAEGMWKYACFSSNEDLVLKIHDRLTGEKKNTLYSTFMDYNSANEDGESERYKDVMESAGDLLVRLVFATKLLCGKANEELEKKGSGSVFVPETLESQFNRPFGDGEKDAAKKRKKKKEDAHGRLALNAFRKKEEEVYSAVSKIKENHYEYINKLLMEADSVCRLCNILIINEKNDFIPGRAIDEYFILFNRDSPINGDKPKRYDFESNNTKKKNAILQKAKRIFEKAGRPRWILCSDKSSIVRYMLLVPLGEKPLRFDAARKVFNQFNRDVAIFHVADCGQYELYLPSHSEYIGCINMSAAYFPICRDIQTAFNHCTSCADISIDDKLFFTFPSSNTLLYPEDIPDFEPMRSGLTRSSDGENINVFKWKGNGNMIQDDVNPRNGRVVVDLTGAHVKGDISIAGGDLLHDSSKTMGNQSPATAGSNSPTLIDATNENTKELIEFLEKFLGSSEVNDIPEDERRELQGIVGSYKEEAPDSKGSVKKRLSEWMKNVALATTLINFARETVPEIVDSLQNMLAAVVGAVS